MDWKRRITEGPDREALYRCCKCRVNKSIEDFYTTKGKVNQWGKVSSYCKLCQREYAKGNAAERRKRLKRRLNPLTNTWIDDTKPYRVLVSLKDPQLRILLLNKAHDLRTTKSKLMSTIIGHWLAGNLVLSEEYKARYEREQEAQELFNELQKRKYGMREEGRRNRARERSNKEEMAAMGQAADPAPQPKVEALLKEGEAATRTPDFRGLAGLPLDTEAEEC